MVVSAGGALFANLAAVPPTKPFASRKLLVAAVGVASINLLASACGGKSATSGNLMIVDGGPDPAPTLAPPTSGNLAPPPPIDASDDADDGAADDGGDAGDGGDSGDA